MAIVYGPSIAVADWFSTVEKVVIGSEGEKSWRDEREMK
jgi:hypothetical protein